MHAARRLVNAPIQVQSCVKLHRAACHKPWDWLTLTQGDRTSTTSVGRKAKQQRMGQMVTNSTLPLGLG